VNEFESTETLIMVVAMLAEYGQSDLGTLDHVLISARNTEVD